jgi:hypothetical protein
LQTKLCFLFSSSGFWNLFLFSDAQSLYTSFCRVGWCLQPCLYTCTFKGYNRISLKTIMPPHLAASNNTNLITKPKNPKPQTQGLGLINQWLLDRV